jgi:tetratricopeptide (TPR) repeat protein
MNKTTPARFLCFPILIVFLVASSPGIAQSRRVDSLSKSVDSLNRRVDSLIQHAAHSKSDTTASKDLFRVAQFYVDQKKEDSGLFYASKGYQLAAKHEFLMGMWGNLAEQCYVYQRRGNYQKTLSSYLDFLKLSEEKKEMRVTTRVLQLISELYIKLGDDEQAIAYAKKNTPLIIETGIGGGWLLGNLYDIGISYIHLHQSDSALAYFQQAFALASDKSKPPPGAWMDQILVGLGMANQQLGNNDIALAYFDKAIQNEKNHDYDDQYFAYMQKGALLRSLNKMDSSIANYTQALQLVSGNYNDQVLMYKALANIYLVKDPARSAKYFEQEQNLRDSLFASEKVNAIQTLTYNEQERQRELANAQKEEAEEHKKNIENISITMGIIAFVLLFLLLSRSIIVNEKWIRFLGIVGLLVLFEFINLLLHPLLESLTHHSSVYMLVIMVAIASLLVPLHHRIEKWVTGKMVEKNKRIRIAAAKRTIEQLSQQVTKEA